jgi:DNA-binding GntR family transcriptional regulator
MKRAARTIGAAGALRGSARAEYAYEAIRLELLEGALAPGDKLSVIDLAAQLQCSRVPIMEALKRLEREELVTIVPQVGCRVVTPGIADVADFFVLFAAVEAAVTALAAERRDADDIVRFRALCRDIDAALASAGGPAAHDPSYRRLNLRFHGEIHAMARSPLASKMAAALWDRSDFYIKMVFGSLYFSRRVIRSHRDIRRAVINGDPVAADAAVRSHLQRVGNAVTEQMAASTSTGPRGADPAEHEPDAPT